MTNKSKNNPMPKETLTLERENYKWPEGENIEVISEKEAKWEEKLPLKNFRIMDRTRMKRGEEVTDYRLEGRTSVGKEWIGEFADLRKKYPRVESILVEEFIRKGSPTSKLLFNPKDWPMFEMELYSTESALNLAVRAYEQREGKKIPEEEMRKIIGTRLKLFEKRRK